MSYFSSNPHGRKPFSSQRCASLQKLRFAQNCVFHKTWVQKGSLLTKKITSEWNPLIIREYLWNLSFAIHVLLQLWLSWQEAFFKPKMCFFAKIEIWSKSCFFVKHGFEKSHPCPRNLPYTEKLNQQWESMEPELHHTCQT